jgi:hypothetical protein
LTEHTSLLDRVRFGWACLSIGQHVLW